jgi:hypothetical protein
MAASDRHGPEDRRCMIDFLTNTWPMFAALGLVTLITVGATLPYIRKDRKRREEMEQKND